MMLQLGADGVVSSVNEADLIYVDKNKLEQFVESYHKLEKENEQLKQQLDDNLQFLIRASKRLGF